MSQGAIPDAALEELIQLASAIHHVCEACPGRVKTTDPHLTERLNDWLRTAAERLAELVAEYDAGIESIPCWAFGALLEYGSAQCACLARMGMEMRLRGNNNGLIGVIPLEHVAQEWAFDDCLPPLPARGQSPATPSENGSPLPSSPPKGNQPALPMSASLMGSRLNSEKRESRKAQPPHRTRGHAAPFEATVIGELIREWEPAALEPTNSCGRSAIQRKRKGRQRETGKRIPTPPPPSAASPPRPAAPRDAGKRASRRPSRALEDQAAGRSNGRARPSSRARGRSLTRGGSHVSSRARSCSNGRKKSEPMSAEDGIPEFPGDLKANFPYGTMPQHQSLGIDRRCPPCQKKGIECRFYPLAQKAACVGCTSSKTGCTVTQVAGGTTGRCSRAGRYRQLRYAILAANPNVYGYDHGLLSDAWYGAGNKSIPDWAWSVIVHWEKHKSDRDEVVEARGGIPLVYPEAFAAQLGEITLEDELHEDDERLAGRETDSTQTPAKRKASGHSRGKRLQSRTFCLHTYGLADSWGPRASQSQRKKARATRARPPSPATAAYNQPRRPPGGVFDNVRLSETPSMDSLRQWAAVHAPPGFPSPSAIDKLWEKASSIESQLREATQEHGTLAAMVRDLRDIAAKEDAAIGGLYAELQSAGAQPGREGMPGELGLQHAFPDLGPPATPSMFANFQISSPSLHLRGPPSSGSPPSGSLGST
ncbi:uncharacterized protein BXZ73DRAFT_83587 [Epithele typhae]|uniref:uncharacterized protein n=1 Tax=Epithele typhae TaxID=378194 RepID=UPI002008686A|nr:uncharacterized protein BXZ73DRAFT_83587 [Epithele typhae]KAH9910425.1 hypothetical protein BXZ73DRAFT_83587 [Epithele typhae]